MPHVVYNLDNAINNFFLEARASSSRTQCDEFAHKKYGGYIRPVDVQGLTSYTVIAGPNEDHIIQFREQSALLNMNMLALARDIHGHVIPKCSELGTIGDSSGQQLTIYDMDRLPGQNYIIARPSLTPEQRLKTVNSLARFFVQSWQSGTPSLVTTSAVRAECSRRFRYLAETLPERFLPAVAESQAALPALCDGRYPLVVTHSDLNEMNILVTPDTGDITGIVDWPDASIQPFGFALYALENMLGSMGPAGWKWFDDAHDLRDLFWTSFQRQTRVSESQMRLIRLAAKAGILVRYGTAYDSGFPGMIGVRDGSCDDFGYLDALLV